MVTLFREILHRHKLRSQNSASGHKTMLGNGRLLSLGGLGLNGNFFAMWLRAMHMIPLDLSMAETTSVSQQSEQSFLAHVASQRRRSSPPSFRSLLPPDFIYRSLQGALHRSLAKSRDVIVCRGDVLRQISKSVTSAGLGPGGDSPSATPALRWSQSVCNSWS